MQNILMNISKNNSQKWMFYSEYFI